VPPQESLVRTGPALAGAGFPPLAGVRHRILAVNGISMHVAEAGAGAPVILCHGFPHLWYSWRHQLPALAAAGYRVIAPDLRGYGHSSAPAEVTEYDSARVCGDILGLIDACGADRPVLVGLDFGAQLVWELAQRQPSRLRAVIVLNNPFTGRSRRRPSEVFAATARDHFLHLHYFQPPGPADAELAARPREFLTRIFWALSGQGSYFSVFAHPADGRGYIDVLPPAPPLPWPWMTAAELDYYAAEFSRTGFTGGLNWYRAMDLRWRDTAGLDPVIRGVPAFFLAGERDVDLAGFSGRDPVGRMRRLVDDLREVVLIPRAGHLVQLEQPAAVTGHLLRFLAGC
jgi:pimeloyl-ACP methyl ester carboxylesterase